MGSGIKQSGWWAESGSIGVFRSVGRGGAVNAWSRNQTRQVQVEPLGTGVIRVNDGKIGTDDINGRIRTFQQSCERLGG